MWVYGGFKRTIFFKNKRTLEQRVVNETRERSNSLTERRREYRKAERHIKQ